MSGNYKSSLILFVLVMLRASTDLSSILLQVSSSQVIFLMPGMEEKGRMVGMSRTFSLETLGECFDSHRAGMDRLDDYRKVRSVSV